MKQVLFGNEAREKLIEGVNLVAKAVSSTIGPRGRNALLSREVAMPIVTNDGVSIATFINKVEDPFVNVGVQAIKEVSAKQNGPGDGTTSATIIASSLVNDGVKHIIAGIDPIEIKEGIERASNETIKELKRIAKPIKTLEEYIQVATISVEDEETGKLIGEMMFEVGKDGAITVETSRDVKLEKDITQGLKFDQGLFDEFFMTNRFRQEAVYEDIPILVTDHLISENDQIVPIADKLLEKGINRLVIICDNVKGEALVTMVNNKIKGVFDYFPIRLPGLDTLRVNNGQDIAVSCGATFVHKDLMNLEDVELDFLGSAKKIISKPDHTVIVEGEGTKKEINDQIKVLKEELKSALSDFDRDQLKERIARLSGGIGVLKIGSATEQELIYKKHKIEDALAATRAAVEEGIVPGGGVALLRLLKESDNIGEKIFYNAIKDPIRKIAENAGKNPDTIIEKILESTNLNYGWDAKKNEFKDMIKSGIIDPCKVVRKAVENASSMAKIFLTCESVIVDIPEEKKPEAPGRLR